MNDVERWCPRPLWLVVSLFIPHPHPHPRRRQGAADAVPTTGGAGGDPVCASTGCAWATIPASFGVSKTAAHRRFTEWVNIGLFTQLHVGLLDLLGMTVRIDWSRCSVGAISVRALKKGA